MWTNHLQDINRGRTARGLPLLISADDLVNHGPPQEDRPECAEWLWRKFLWRAILISAVAALLSLGWLLYELFPGLIRGLFR
jgi:hypothetical protein